MMNGVTREVCPGCNQLVALEYGITMKTCPHCERRFRGVK